MYQMYKMCATHVAPDGKNGQNLSKVSGTVNKNDGWKPPIFTHFVAKSIQKLVKADLSHSRSPRSPK